MQHYKIDTFLKMLCWLIGMYVLLFNDLYAQPLPHSHAHNDYEHDEPLFRALENGFLSLEADVFAKGGRLKVSHVNFFLVLKPTLTELYLEPLNDIIKENGGQVYAGYPDPVVLMIDIKQDGETTYDLLKQALTPYKDLLTTYRNDSVISGALEINLSGHCPLALLKEEKERWATADLSIEKGLDSNLSHHLVKRVSSPYRKYFKWRGMGTQPIAEKNKLDSLVALAHTQQKQIRFYAAPNNEKVWTTLLDAGVDWINVNKLKSFNAFMHNRMKH